MDFRIILIAVVIAAIAQLSIAERCAEFKDCVQCRMYKKGAINKNACSIDCISIVPIIVEAAICERYDIFVKKKIFSNHIKYFSG